MKYLYGASGHAKVVLDIIKSNNDFVSGIFDDDTDKNKFQEVKYLGLYEGNDQISINDEVLISIGNNQIRKSIAKTIKHRFFTTFHKECILSTTCKIGLGTVVMPYAVVNANAIIGNHCIINTAAIIEHDCILEDFVHIAPNSTLTGNVNVGEGSLIGVGSVVIPGINIGKWCLIGAGSVITEDVPDYAVVVGNPGKVIKFNEK